MWPIWSFLVLLPIVFSSPLIDGIPDITDADRLQFIARSLAAHYNLPPSVRIHNIYHLYARNFPLLPGHEGQQDEHSAHLLCKRMAFLIVDTLDAMVKEISERCGPEAAKEILDILRDPVTTVSVNQATRIQDNRIRKVHKKYNCVE